MDRRDGRDDSPAGLTIEELAAMPLQEVIQHVWQAAEEYKKRVRLTNKLINSRAAKTVEQRQNARTARARLMIKNEQHMAELLTYIRERTEREVSHGT